jgi:hypothetical protein
MGKTNFCIDCGAPTGGVRCRPCNGLHLALEAARALDEEDRSIIEMVEREKLTANRLGERLGVSGVWAHQKLVNARRRQALLADGSAGNFRATHRRRK